MLRSIRRRFARLGLQRRIMLYVSAGLVLFSAIYGLVALQAIEQTSNLVFSERLLVAQALARELDDSLTHLQGDLEGTRATIAPALAARDFAATQNSLLTLYDHWISYHHFGNTCILSLADAHGNVLWTLPERGNSNVGNVAPFSYLRAMFKEPRQIIVSGFASDGSGTRVVTLVAPIQENQQTLGFLIGEVDQSHIANALEPDLRVIEAGYTVEAVDNTGLVMASDDKAREASPSHHLELIAPLLQEREAGTRTHTSVINSEDRSHVIAFAPLTKMPWGVVVEQEEDEAFLLPHNLERQFLLFGLLALAGGLVLAWLTTRTVVQPVNALIHASQEIARGDLEHPLDISDADEVGALVRSFDEMRVELKQSREEIAQWNRELEVRVERRTRELKALVESSHALTSTLELDALFEILMQRTHEVLPTAEGIALFLLEPEMQMLAVRSTFGFDAEACLNLRFQLGEAIGGQVFQAQAPALLKTALEVRTSQANLGAENRVHFRQAVGNREVRSALGVPLLSKGTRLGALVLYNFSQEAAFANSDVPVLQALVDQAAAAIENARLYQEASEAGTLRELNRLKSEFVARASHELRTPLTAVKSLAETLLRPDLNLDEPTRREFLEGIDSASDRLNEIVKQLLMLSRVEAGRLEIRDEPLDAGAVIARVVARFQAQSPQRAIDVAVAEDLPLVRGDAERVEDVLTNLVSNALKYSSAESPVAIRAQAYDRMVAVFVQDAGIGIPHTVHAKIFERFYRVDNAVTRRVGGAGLGLHLCKTYVEAMDGAIRVESEEGRGSTFSFTLPQANEEI